MPSTPSPCCTPVVIYDSSDDAISSNESVQAGFSTDDDNSHLLILADRIPFQSELSRSISSTVAVAGSTVIPSSLVSSIASATGTAATASNFLCTNTTSLEPISYRCTPSSGSCNCLPKDIAESPCFPPLQPSKTRYPSTMISNVSRCFNPAWYKSFQWLEYSVEKDACFCYPCWLFGLVSAIGNSRPETVFTLKTGNMPLVKKEFFLVILVVLATKSQWWHGNNMGLILNEALLFQIKLTVPGKPQLPIIGIT